MRALYAIVLLGLLAVACVDQQTIIGNDNTTAPPTVATGAVIRETVQIPEGDGRIVMLLTASGDPGVRSVQMTVDNVEVYSPTSGWVSINGDEKAYELTGLQGRQLGLGERVVDAESYTQVRMRISSVMVTDDNGQRVAVLPTNEFVVATGVGVATGATSAVTFDFLLDQSVRRTQDGEYVFLPVVRVLAQGNATLNVVTDNVVVQQGTTVYEVVYGTDVRGVTGPEVRVPQNTIIVVESGRIVTDTTNTVVNNTVVNNTVVNNTVTNTTVVANTTVVVNGTAGNTAGNGTLNGTAGVNTTTRTNATVNATANATNGSVLNETAPLI